MHMPTSWLNSNSFAFRFSSACMRANCDIISALVPRTETFVPSTKTAFFPGTAEMLTCRKTPETSYSAQPQTYT